MVTIGLTCRLAVNRVEDMQQSVILKQSHIAQFINLSLNQYNDNINHFVHILCVGNVANG